MNLVSPLNARFSQPDDTKTAGDCRRDSTHQECRIQSRPSTWVDTSVRRIFGLT